MKIVIDREVCIGAAPCVAIAPKTFALDNIGKAYLLDAHGDSEDMIKKAAESCPVQAITLYDDEGNVIYPKISMH